MPAGILFPLEEDSIENLIAQDGPDSLVDTRRLYFLYLMVRGGEFSQFKIAAMWFAPIASPFIIKAVLLELSPIAS